MIYLGNKPVGVAEFRGIPDTIPKIDDGNAYIYLYFPDENDLDITIHVASKGSTNSFSVDWGDGATEVKANVAIITHTYSNTGFYAVKLVIISGTPRLGGAGNTWLAGGSAPPERANAAKLIGLETGTWGIASAEFLNNSSAVVLYAKRCSLVSYNCLYANSCRLLKKVELPENSYALNGSGFNGCFSLSEITITEGCTAIGNQCFQSCGKLVIHMEATTPPTLGGSTAFNGDVITICVPTGSLSAYQTAENWSAYADKMIEE